MRLLHALLFFTCAVYSEGPATAQLAEAALYADLEPGSEDHPFDNGIGAIARFDDEILFTSEDARHGAELWRAQLGVDGSKLIRDLCAGPCSDLDQPILAGLGRRRYAASRTGLWEVDGFSVEQLSSNHIGELTVGSGRLFFVSYDFTNSVQILWTRTAGGSQSLHQAQHVSLLPSPPNGPLFFVAGTNREASIYRTDGTATGTFEVLRNVFPRGFSATPVGDRLLLHLSLDGEAQFVSLSGARDDERRTVAPPRSFLPGWIGSDRISSLPVLDDGTAFFLVGLERTSLWSIDATTLALRPLMSICSDNHCEDGVISTLPAIASGRRLVFLATDQSNRPSVWSSDGTSGGTDLIVDLAPENAFLYNRLLHRLGDDVVFVTHSNSETKLQIWRTDGTRDGTRGAGPPLLEDPNRIVASNEILALQSSELFSYESKLRVMGAEDASPRLVPIQPALIQSAVGDVAFVRSGDKVIALRSDLEQTILRQVTAQRSSSPTDLTASPSGLIFDTALPAAKLWLVEDGEGPPVNLSARPTSRWSVKRWQQGGAAVHDGDLFYLPAATGTVRLLPGLNVWDYWVARDKLFVNLLDSTFRVLESPFDSAQVLATGFQRHATYLGDVSEASIFATRVGSLESELWRTDGTSAGTWRFAGGLPLLFVDFTGTHGGVSLGHRLVFYISGQLYITDGTPGTPLQLAEGVRALASTGSHALFLKGALENPDLWRTDGTPEGTIKIATLPGWSVGAGVSGEPNPPSHSFPSRHLFEVGGLVYFVLEVEGVGTELWRSDGTAGGTRMVVDLCTGPCGSNPNWFSNVNERLVYSASNGLSGMEPWVTDGSSQGTHLLADVSPGPESSNPAWYTQLGSSLFFQAADDEHGIELWRLPLPDLDPCPDRACLDDGRFEVTVHWKAPDGTEGVGTPIPFSDESSLFWFFNESNVELVVKVLDGRPINDHFWFYSGALSDVEYEIELVDTTSGVTKNYTNEQGEICGIADVQAIHDPSTPAPPSWRDLLTVPPDSLGKAAPCPGDDTTLCLQDGRFRVQVALQAPDGSSGVGRPIPATSESGYFWFFSPENLELVVKILDGTAINGHWWVFFGALSDVGYSLTVTDTESGTSKVFENPQGEICGQADIEAF